LTLSTCQNGEEEEDSQKTGKYEAKVVARLVYTLLACFLTLKIP